MKRYLVVNYEEVGFPLKLNEYSVTGDSPTASTHDKTFCGFYSSFFVCRILDFFLLLLKSGQAAFGLLDS